MNDTFTFSTINKRKNNEDCCIAYVLKVGERDYTILLLADGMGGHNHGEEFSRMVIETMASLINGELLAQELIPYSKTEKFSITEGLLHSVLVSTNQVIRDKMAQNGWHTGGTTIAAVVATEDRFWSISLGDSLIYRWSASEGKLHQISDDHSITGILLKRGAITPEEAKTHQLRNRLRYFLGMDEIPLLEEIENAANGNLEDNDVLMLCSDGICGVLSLEEIQNLFKKNQNLENLAQELIVEARLKGQTDNQTLVLYGHKHISEPPQILKRNNFELTEEKIRELVKKFES